MGWIGLFAWAGVAAAIAWFGHLIGSRVLLGIAAVMILLLACIEGVTG